MGQRSQIYISFTLNNGTDGGNASRYLIARYYGWTFGSSIVSRVRHTVEWLEAQLKHREAHMLISKASLMLDVDFDRKRIDLSEDCMEHARDAFLGQLNDDGKAFISVGADGAVSYCFTDDRITAPMTAADYMKWDRCADYTEEDKGSNYTANCEFLSRCRLMTNDELREFISAAYANYKAPAGDGDGEVDMVKVFVESSPYATQNGSIWVPKGMTEDEERKYITDHWDEIRFGEPELDYEGTDFTVSHKT